jgi:hypothetical protein
MKFSKLLIAAAAATVTMTTQAQSLVVNVANSMGNNDGGVVSVSGVSKSTTPEEFQLLDDLSGKTFAFYCLEPLDDTGGAPLLYNLVNNTTPALSANAIDGIARLFAAAGFNGAAFGTDAVVTGTEAAALQIAIWEVAYDGLTPVGGPETAYNANQLSGAGYTSKNDGTSNWTTDGVFTADQFSFNTLSQATSYLNAAAHLTAGQYSAADIRLYQALDGGNQNLVTSVPEPGTYALMAACLGVIGLVSRRKQA